jgi:hypothetical protein
MSGLDMRRTNRTDDQGDAVALCVLVSLFTGIGAWTWWQLVRAVLGLG